MVESGFKDYVTCNYFGLLAPPNTPPDVIKTLHDATVEAVVAPDVIAEIKSQGMDPVGNQPNEFAKMLAEDLQRWTQLIKDAGRPQQGARHVQQLDRAFW